MELLNCALCESEFNDPVTLPCGHSFCKLCIRKHGVKKVFKCKFCFKYFSLKILEVSTSAVLVEFIREFKYEKEKTKERESLIKKLNEKIVKIELETEDWKEKAKVVKTDLENMEKLVREKDFTIEVLQSNLIDKTQTISSLNQSLSEKNNILSLLEQSISEKSDFIQKLQNTMTSLTQDINSKEEKFTNHQKQLDQKNQELKELENSVIQNQQSLIQREKDFEILIQEKISFFNQKQKEIDVKFREIQVKELLFDRKYKNFKETEQKCEILQKDLNFILKNKQVLGNRRRSIEDIRDKSESRTSKNQKPRLFNHTSSLA